MNETVDERRESCCEDRRTMLKGICLAAGAAGLGFAKESAAQVASADVALLNYLLNLEYLQCQFYSYALFGVSMDTNLLGGPGAAGFGAQGTVSGGRRMSFPTSMVERLATELRGEQERHVRYLRTLLPGDVVPQPALNIGGGQAGAFTTMARLAGIIGPADTFDPYGSETDFLLAAFLLEDVGVTAYRATASQIADPLIADGVAGMMATESQHAGAIRYQLWRRSGSDVSLLNKIQRLSNLRNTLDGLSGVDRDLSPTSVDGWAVASIVPADTMGMVGGRTPGQVLSILYGTRGAATAGAFFPSGVNGSIRASA